MEQGVAQRRLARKEMFGEGGIYDADQGLSLIHIFSTALDIALANGAAVLPYPWRDASAEAFAASKGAMLASGRSAPGKYSLSPASLQHIARHTALVLPSPNGSALSLRAGTVPTFTACFRNCVAVAARAARYGWAAYRLKRAGGRFVNDGA